MKAPDQRYWRFFIVNFEHILQLFKTILQMSGGL